jgi:(E)-4-hydroxy-3-methylbut-2-enyl-diphosphate synthase
VPEAQIVETLIEEAMRIASEMNTGEEADHGPGTTSSGSPIVTVS